MPSLVGSGRLQEWPAVVDACATYAWTSAENLTDLDADISRLLSDDRDVVFGAGRVEMTTNSVGIPRVFGHHPQKA